MPRFALAVCLGAVLLTAPAQAQNSLQKVQQNGVLRWGADPSGGAPFVFTNPLNPGEVVGFEVELMERLAARMGVRAELVRSDWNSLPANLDAGRIDVVMNGLEVTEERKKAVLFTVSYYRYSQQLTVRARDRDKYKSLADLKGKKVAVLKGSAAEGVLTENGWDEDDIVGLDDSLKPFEVLKAKRVEAVLCESIIANYYAAEDGKLALVAETFSPGEYAAAVRQDDPELLLEINKHLKEMKKSGELGELYQRWDLWTPQQEELGVNKGSPQEVIPLAHRIYLRWEVVGQIALQLLQGAGYTLLLTVTSMPLALAFGLGLALMTRARRWWWRWPAVVYIQVIRGTPLLVQVFVIYFSLPMIDQWLELGELLVWPELAVGILCLSANYAAYEAEIHRAGLEGVPKGQREAALSLGMSEPQAFVHIVLPQSFRLILPPVINDLVSMLKDSCIVSVIGVGELLYVATAIGKSTFMLAQLLLAAAFLYLLMSLVADFLGKRIEARLRRGGATTISGNAPHH